MRRESNGSSEWENPSPSLHCQSKKQNLSQYVPLHQFQLSSRFFASFIILSGRRNQGQQRTSFSSLPRAPHGLPANPTSVFPMELPRMRGVVGCALLGQPGLGRSEVTKPPQGCSQTLCGGKGANVLGCLKLFLNRHRSINRLSAVFYFQLC